MADENNTGDEQFTPDGSMEPLSPQFKDKRHSEKYADWNNDYLDYVKYMSGETVSLEAQQSEETVSNN